MFRLYVFFLSIIVVTAQFRSFAVSHSFRLHPNQDLVHGIIDYVNQFKIEAGSISVAVGVDKYKKIENYIKSVKWCTLRMANQPYLTRIEGPMEIVSLIGTYGIDNQHVHISLSDYKGVTVSGHLPSLDERIDDIKDSCIIYTTAEIVLLEHVDLKYTREIDPETTYHELVIKRKTHNSEDSL